MEEDGRRWKKTEVCYFCVCCLQVDHKDEDTTEYIFIDNPNGDFGGVYILQKHKIKGVVRYSVHHLDTSDIAVGSDIDGNAMETARQSIVMFGFRGLLYSSFSESLATNEKTIADALGKTSASDVPAVPIPKSPKWKRV